MLLRRGPLQVAEANQRSDRGARRHDSLIGELSSIIRLFYVTSVISILGDLGMFYLFRCGDFDVEGKSSRTCD